MSSEQAYVGWIRPAPSAPWRPVVRGATYAVAAGDKLILPAGQTPDPPKGTRIKRSAGRQ